ncbi:unnamed protein product [Moneuplotes crassus]|uniref:Uncharacterized protein n=1 Tax=Euplotes crassus TaxID=5936 RepID=A0AAD1ULA9_EUPCR|nr:unnamed protein product [Moneuplotes crassus]
MKSNQQMSSSIDYTGESPVKSYMSGTSSLPGIHPKNEGLNKSQDFAQTNLAFVDGLNAAKPKIKKKKRKRNYKTLIAEEGTEMFNAQMESKTSKIQMSLIQNRIKRLEFEEQRAREKILKAKNEAERIQALQHQKQAARSQKIKFQAMEKRKLEGIRQQNSLDRMRMKQHIIDLQNYKIDQNHKKRLQLQEEVNRARELSEMLRKEENDYIMHLKNKVKGDKYCKKTLRHRLKTNMDFNKKNAYQSKISQLKNDATQNYSTIQEMENKEREMLDRLKITFKSVEDQEREVKKLQRNGKRRPLKNTKSVIAEYISTPLMKNNGLDGDSPFQLSPVKKRKSSKLVSQGNDFSAKNRNDSISYSHQMAETGQERKN